MPSCGNTQALHGRDFYRKWLYGLQINVNSVQSKYKMGKYENREICVMENGTKWARLRPPIKKIATGYPLRPTEDLVPRKKQWPLFLEWEHLQAHGGAVLPSLSLTAFLLPLFAFYGFLIQAIHSFQVLFSLHFINIWINHGNRGSQSKDKMWPCSLGRVTVFGPAWGGRLRGLCGPDMVGMRWGTRQSSWSDHHGLGRVTITIWIRPEEP